MRESPFHSGRKWNKKIICYELPYKLIKAMDSNEIQNKFIIGSDKFPLT